MHFYIFQNEVSIKVSPLNFRQQSIFMNSTLILICFSKELLTSITTNFLNMMYVRLFTKYIALAI